MAAERGTHEWTEAEREATIDAHIAIRNGRDRRAVLDELAAVLKLPLGKVGRAVDAVGTCDPSDSRTYPRPSVRLREQWALRGFSLKRGFEIGRLM